MKEKKEIPLVSVIMPVYNGEQYIEKSIGSVFKQSHCAVELLVVNDGSKDESARKLEEMKKVAPEHVTVKVFHQENQGICHSRNKALDEATGKYVMFIDQDDFMREDCIAALCREIEDTEADFVIGGFDLVNQQDEILEEWQLDPSLPWHKFRITGPWGRIFRKEIIDKHHIRFMITKISEDFYFNMLYMSYCEKIHITPYKGYCWLFNEKSESHAKMSQLEEDRNPLVMLTQLHQDMKTPNILEPEYVEYMMVKHIIWYLFFVAKSAKKETLNHAYEECISWLREYYPKFTRNKLVRLTRPKGETFKIRLIVFTACCLLRIRCLKPVLNLYAKL